jgi:hypothetical protein
MWGISRLMPTGRRRAWLGAAVAGGVLLLGAVPAPTLRRLSCGRHTRQRTLKISPDWLWKDAFRICWQRPRTRLTSTIKPCDTEGESSRRGRGRCPPRHTGQHHLPTLR